MLSRDKYEIKPDTFIVVDKAAGKGNGGGKGKGKKGKKGKDPQAMAGMAAGMYGAPQMPMPGMGGGAIGPPGAHFGANHQAGGGKGNGAGVWYQQPQAAQYRHAPY